MIHPAPTGRIDPKTARGVLISAGPTVAKVSFPNTNYELHLVPQGAIHTEPGRRILGIISAQARRIDTVQTGGRYVEPVMGRPRRVQGSILAVLAGSNTLVVDAGMPVHVTPTDTRQKAADFQPGEFVSFDVLEGASLTESHAADMRPSPHPAAAPSPTP